MTRATTLSMITACLVLAARPAAGDDAAIVLRDGTGDVAIGDRALVASLAPGAPDPRFSFVPDPSLFVASGPDVDLHPGISDRTWWIAFRVTNLDAAEDGWLVSAGSSQTARIRLVVVGQEDGEAELVAGAESRDSSFGRALDRYLLPVRFPRGKTVTVYLGFRSEQSIHLDARVMRASEANGLLGAETLLAGLSLGLVLAVAALSLRSGRGLKSPSRPWLAFYSLSMAAHVLVAKGFASAWFWPGNAWLDVRALPLTSCALAFTAIMVTRERPAGPGARGPAFFWFSALAFLPPVMAAGIAIGDLRSWRLAGGILLLVVMASIVVAAISRLVARKEGAGLVAAAWCAMVTGSAATQLGVLGLPLGSWEILWRSGDQLGGAIQCSLLAVAFARASDRERRARETESAAALGALERANRVKEDFMESIGSALEGSLLAVADAVDRADAGCGEPGSRDLALARAELARAVSSVEGIEAFARARHGDFDVSPSDVRIADLVAMAASVARDVVDGTRVAIETEASDDVVRLDAAQVGRFLARLALYAAARTERGAVRLEGSARDGLFVAAVVDRGAPPRVPLPGDPSVAGGGPGREDYGPLAVLNLFVASEYARALGGALSFDSKDGKNRYELSLPCAPRASSGFAPEAVPASLPSASAMRRALEDAARADRETAGAFDQGRALVAAGDALTLAGLEATLRGAGFRTIGATSASDAIRAFRQEGPFDLVVARAWLPGSSGFELCRSTRAASEGGARVPFILLLGSDRAEDVEEAFAAGADDFVSARAPRNALAARARTQARLGRLVGEAAREAREMAEIDHWRRLGILAAGVAHEINTPVAAVLRDVPVLKRVWDSVAPALDAFFRENPGFVVGAWDWSVAERAVPSMLEDMYRSGHQIRTIVEDLKRYAGRPAALAREKVDLVATSEYVARLLASGARARGATLQVTRPAEPVEASGDPWRTTQILLNLAENALDAIEDGAVERSVNLSPRREGGMAVVECADSGRGLGGVDPEKLFEPFYTTKRESGGLGLGLPISLGYAKEAGGTISFSPRVGGGTVARLELPAFGEEVPS